MVMSRTRTFLPSLVLLSLGTRSPRIPDHSPWLWFWFVSLLVLSESSTSVLLFTVFHSLAASLTNSLRQRLLWKTCLWTYFTSLIYNLLDPRLKRFSSIVLTVNVRFALSIGLISFHSFPFSPSCSSVSSTLPRLVFPETSGTIL